MSGPWLSVVMPTYNGAAYLGQALDSIVDAGTTDIEIIAVDDGSTDATVAILHAHARRLPLTVVERRAGSWAANTNLGLGLARGEWACFLHQDDLWRPGRLTALRRGLATGAVPALLLHAADFIDPAGRRVGQWRCPLPPGPRGSAPARTVARLLVQNFVPLPVAVFRLADALAVGGLDPQLWYTADWDFWLKLAARGQTRYLRQSLAAFRLHPDSQTIQRSGGLAEFRQQQTTVWERHWPAWRDRLAKRQQVAAVGRLSIEVNVLLAGLLNRGGLTTGMAAVLRGLALAQAASIAGCAHYVNTSRIVERVAARVRAGLTKRAPNGR